MPIQDKVRLGEQGWKKRYYENKFSVHSAADICEFTNKIKQSYIEGL
jgi:5'-3' exonuclease